MTATSVIIKNDKKKKKNQKVKNNFCLRTRNLIILWYKHTHAREKLNFLNHVICSRSHKHKHLQTGATFVFIIKQNKRNTRIESNEFQKHKTKRKKKMFKVCLFFLRHGKKKVLKLENKNEEETKVGGERKKWKKGKRMRGKGEREEEKKIYKRK